MNRKQFVNTILTPLLLPIINACKNKSSISKPLANNQPIASISNEYEPVTYFKKGDAEYEFLRKGFNKRINKYPAVIALCKSTEDVQQAVKYARKYKLPISIKSGGHSFEGYSCNDQGMVINCSSFNSIKWIDENTILVNPGCLIKDLYKEILPKNKILPAGSCGGVGLGGLTLGGGYGLFSRKYGLTCDHLSELTLVNANGNIVNSTNNPDILWACRGGGNGNFGVITEMKFQLQDISPLIVCSRFTTRKPTNQRTVEILKQWFNITENLPSCCFSAFVYNGRNIYILLTNIDHQNTPCQEEVSQLKILSDNTLTSNPLKISNAVTQFYGLKNPVFFKNSSVGLYDRFENIEPFIKGVVEKISNSKGIIFQVNTLGGNIINADFEKASAYPHRNKKWLSELQTYWQTDEKTSNMIRNFDETKALFKEAQGAQYCNYPDADNADWQHKYYGSNYERLQKIKRSIDPENIFTFHQSIET